MILAAGVSIGWAQAFIEASAVSGVGAPGHFAAQGKGIVWVPDAAVATAPPNAVTVPPPIRALLANEQFGLYPPGPFGSWMVIRTDLEQTPPTTDQTLAALAAAIAALQVQVAQLLAR